jgi:hypothetical protein
LLIRLETQLSSRKLLLAGVFEALNGDTRDKLLNEKVAAQTVILLPLPQSTATRKEARGTFGQKLGKADETLEQLPGGGDGRGST